MPSSRHEEAPVLPIEASAVQAALALLAYAEAHSNDIPLNLKAVRENPQELIRGALDAWTDDAGLAAAYRAYVEARRKDRDGGRETIELSREKLSGLLEEIRTLKETMH